MHILYLHQYFVPPDGNGGTRSLEFARRLVKTGHDVTLITSSAFFPKHYDITKSTTSLRIDGIDIRVIQVPYSNHLSYSQRIKAFLAFAFKAMIETARVRNVDIIFATSTPLTIALPGILGTYLHKKPMVFEVRDLWPAVPVAMGILKKPYMIWAAERLEKFAYNNSAHVITLSRGMADGVIKAGYPAEQITVIPNSCDDLFSVPESDGKAFLDRQPFLKGGPIVSYTGTMGMVNGIHYLIDIAGHMLRIDSSVRFLIVGDGRQEKVVRARAEKLGILEKNVWILPPVAKKDVPTILSASTVATSFVINVPALWHNSANKVFDAFAAGRPVMINHEGWQADILRKSGAGIVVPPDDPEGAARMLHEFLIDEDRMERARKAASLLSDTVFNRDKLFGKLLQVLESVHKSREKLSH